MEREALVIGQVKVLNDVERVLGRSGYKVAISYKRLFKLIKIKSN